MAGKSFFDKLVGNNINEEDPDENIAELSLDEPETEEENVEAPIATTVASKVKTRQAAPLAPAEDLLGQDEGQLTLDVFQTPTEVIIKSTVAGVKPEDIDIAINNDMVTIRGLRQKDEEIETKDYYYQELYWGSFSRSVILPVEVDADEASASLKNGILTVRLPKLDRSKNKKVKVKLE